MVVRSSPEDRGSATPSGRRLSAVSAMLAPCRERPNVRRTARIALVVGSILTLINQLDVMVEGRATALTGVKIALNFAVPFCVSNLGVITAHRTIAQQARP